MSSVRVLLSALAIASVATVSEARDPQYVLISFDGANDNSLWERSLRLADETSSRFTYFLSCVYLLAPEDRRLYQPPGMKAGRSNVGVGASRDDVAARLGHIWAAYQTGHEIGSHGCGHFDGKDWAKAAWLAEFEQFDSIVKSAWERNGLAAPAGWADLASRGIRGFRAPYLSTGAKLDAALAEAGFAYDASAVSRGPQMPARVGERAEFALSMIPEGPSGRRIIAMDYNLFVRHSGGIERASGAEEFAERTYRAFAAAFEAEYGGERRPLQMGFHFQLMNGGAYWDALERFAREACVKPDVRCVTYTDWMRANPAPSDPSPAGG